MALNDILLTTAEQFIDIALGFTGILVIYYIYRLFTVEKGPSDDSELEGRREAAGRWLGERRERAEHQAASNRRQRLLDPARGFLIQAEQLMERLRDEDLRAQTAAAVREARDHAESAVRRMQSALRVIRAARAGARGDLRDQIMGLADSCQATLEHVRNDLIPNLPAHTDPPATWDTNVGTVRDNAEQVIGFLGQLIHAIDEFIEHDRLAAPTITRPGRGRPRPSPSPHGYP